MLADFLHQQRPALIRRAEETLLARANPAPTQEELRDGIPLFLDQLEEALRRRQSEKLNGASVAALAEGHGEALHRVGLTIAQVVQDYGDVCQSITELAMQEGEPVSLAEFHTLNLCLDEAIAGAVSGFARKRVQVVEGQGTERIGMLAHELRNHLHTALLSFESIKGGVVPINGSTGQVLGRSLQALKRLVDRSMAEVRLEAGLARQDLIPVRELVEDVEIGAVIQARSKGVLLTISSPVDRSAAVRGDRQILAAALSNLLQNAVKFTRSRGRVSLTGYTTDDLVQLEVADECGGLAAGGAEKLFHPFEQHGQDRTGLGLGLAISLRAARASGGTIRARDIPGKGCVFTLELPRAA